MKWFVLLGLVFVSTLAFSQSDSLCVERGHQWETYISPVSYCDAVYRPIDRYGPRIVDLPDKRLRITDGWSYSKDYRCIACDKKKSESVTVPADTLVLWQRGESYPERLRRQSQNRDLLGW
jgi:hypothetical protein